MEILTNPVFLSVVIMTTLCLLKVPVLIALMVAAMLAGVFAGMPFSETMSVFFNGIGGNGETALSYVLLGALAFSMTKTGASDVLAQKISKAVKGNKISLCIIILVASIASGTIIPVHIAFIPILIPPLLSLMNELKYDRRLAAVTFGFGLKAPYIAIPIAYGAIFHGIVYSAMSTAGLDIPRDTLLKTNWIAFLAMAVGMIIGWKVYYKNRTYEQRNVSKVDLRGDLKVETKHYFALFSGILALVIQLLTNSLPLGAIVALLFLIVTGSIKWRDFEDILQGGVSIMGLMGFIMLAASGYAEVVVATGAVDELVTASIGFIGGSKFLGILLMALVGLLIDMGIGTSFGTVPIIAPLYVPLGLQLGLSPAAIAFVISVSAALGDAGSPASDTSLGPTAGLNVDGQHDHIWDTCIPQMIFNTGPLFIILLFVPLLL